MLYLQTTTLTSADSTMISSGCVGSIPNMNECIPSFMTQGDNQTITTCCSTDKCNDGTTDQGNYEWNCFVLPPCGGRKMSPLDSRLYNVFIFFGP